MAYLGDAFYHPKKKPTRLIFADGSEAVRREIRRVIETNFSDEVDVVFPGDDFVDVHKKRSQQRGSASEVVQYVGYFSF